MFHPTDKNTQFQLPFLERARGVVHPLRHGWGSVCPLRLAVRGGLQVLWAHPSPNWYTQHNTQQSQLLSQLELYFAALPFIRILVPPISPF